MTGILYPTFCGVVGGGSGPATFIPETTVPPHGWASAASNYNYGNRFTTEDGFTMRAVSFYSNGLGSDVPSNFRLWDADADTVLMTQVPTPPSGAGWKRTVLAVPVVLSVGVNYVLGYLLASDVASHGWYSSPPSVNSPFTHLGVRYSTGDPTPTPTHDPVTDDPLHPYLMMAISFDDAP
jgi:hypothetical protein